MDELIAYIKEEQERWLNILNSEYKTDGGKDLGDYAKGRLTTYTEILNYLAKENKDARATEEEGRIGKTAEA
jgi:hypothetical protein